MLPEGVVLYRPLDRFPPKSLTELSILKISKEIRDKPKWFEKVLQADIVTKWKSEAVAQGLREEEAEFTIDFVKHCATLRDGCVEPGPVQATWIADGLIDDELSAKLKKLVAEGLENVSEDEKDYHPGSDKLVVDLVHPSLFCYVENSSLLINEDKVDREFLPAEADEEPTPPKRICIDWEDFDAEPPSGSFRWLPSEVAVKDDGSVTIDSYINNLHPGQHKELYDVLKQILAKFIPMLNHSLTDVANWRENLINLTGWSWYDPEDEFVYDGDGDDEDAAHAEWVRNREILPVPIKTFKAPKLPTKIFNLKGDKLQMIFKLANIELTPEKPKYGGGTWHVEGIDQERIVATGIYYYEVENVTESKLTFRQSITEPDYEQNDDRGVLAVYGLKNEGPLNQIVGSLTAQQGRCIVFPNVYQHHVAPFKLTDETKPGFRKILVFFLVDPTIKVISTQNVLPQQPDWMDVNPDAPADKRKTMTREQAESYREKLMFARKYARDEYQKEYYEREFSLCEH